MSEWTGFAVPLAVADCGAKGKGLVATEHIAKGALIYDSSVEGVEVGFTEEELVLYLEQLSPDERRTIMSHIYCHSGKAWLIPGNGKYTNHARPPTTGCAKQLAAVDVVPPDTAAIADTFALRDINVGDEITEDYANMDTLPWYETLCVKHGAESTSVVAEKYS
eukprot:gnl/TRDRNA2_/TRDRNA2_87866_c0_seq1.p1 gnl/TRDRNA2_/TRDRNA2_87866_c0~~gnl/TRDRNA2_/TRDRNA2_87866_c0_seq1.p1  ORF type:complete len:164 (-),score=24.04 gnl/TRDRNA2_/TRDRNA2_87866_c0_seq1:144-635(-)